MAAGIQQNKQNTHKSMSTVGTIVYNSDLFSDVNTINTMAAALYFHEQQKVWCVLAMEQGKTFVQVCQDFVVKYANAGISRQGVCYEILQIYEVWIQISRMFEEFLSEVF